jgi:non-homologous end joining protein Ku
VFDPSELHSDYEERVLAMVERKARGETVKHERAPQKPAPEPSLVAALQASVAKVSPARGAARPAARPGVAKAGRRGEESRKSA